MNLGFKARFVPLVKSGAKRHTVRAGKRWRVGMRGDLWENMRGPKNSNRPQTLIYRAPIVRVEDFLSERSPRVFGPGSEGAFFRIFIDGHLLDPDELEAFARADGFADSRQMHLWLNSERRPLTLEGQVIHWDYERRELAGAA